MVDPYETANCDENGQPQYVPTAKVLRHFDHEINTVLGGIEGTDGQMKKARIALLAGTIDLERCGNMALTSQLIGADLVMSMGTIIHYACGPHMLTSLGEPGLWAPKDLDTILGQYGAFIIERSGTDVDEALASLRQYEHNIWVISQVIQNDISSTKVRLFLKKDLSVRYLIPDPVVEV
jgi:nicotinamide mononucleotide adenylyltransferase